MITRNILVFALCAGASLAQDAAPLRPPAVPLITHDPYFSVWSMSDNLTDQATKHWTGTEQPLTGLIRIDGKTFRFMGGGAPAGRAGGGPARGGAEPTEAMKQVSREVTPTRTIYGFEAAGVRLDLTFLSPLLPDSLELVSRPVTYLVWNLKSTDGREHQSQLYFDFSSQMVVNTTDQKAMWSRHTVGNMDVIRMGSVDQKLLWRSGDNLRIDWGYLYLAVPRSAGDVRTVGYSAGQRGAALRTWEFPESDDLEPQAQSERSLPVAAAVVNTGNVAATGKSGHLILAYDDLYSIEYFRRPLRPYWRTIMKGPRELLLAAEKDFDSLQKRAAQFDQELTKDLVASGGAKYAALAILAYRHTYAAHKLAVDGNGDLLYFGKENFSNGCIATVDVLYPSAPFFLLLNPEIMRAQLRPILDYAQSKRWKWPFAPHDLGRYPWANGQVYGGGELTEDRQMPVEESGNMLILLAALAKAEGTAEFSRPYLPVMKRWAEYLRQKGLDPENQLSTDDFAGHLAHNTNLSVKAIIALRSFAEVAGQLGENSLKTEYVNVAKEMAAKWGPMADDGDHFRLAFDQKGTWSQKYNLVWDKLLGYKLFPADITRKEIAFYKTKQNGFGLPLDNRADYTKLDWVLWTATLADNQQDFAAIADPAYRFANETPTRVPLSDWYFTSDGKQRGFQARPVVGGIYIKMLEDGALWKKWAAKGGR